MLNCYKTSTCSCWPAICVADSNTVLRSIVFPWCANYFFPRLDRAEEILLKRLHSTFITQMWPTFSVSCFSRLWTRLDCWLLGLGLLNYCQFEDCSQECSESKFCSHCVSNGRTCLLFGPASVAMVDAFVFVWAIVDALTPVGQWKWLSSKFFFRLSSWRWFIGPKQSHWKTTKHFRWKRFRLPQFVARKTFEGPGQVFLKGE